MKQIVFISLIIVISGANLKANDRGQFNDSVFKQDSVFISNSILFHFATDSIHSMSYELLDSLIEFMKMNKTIIIEISTHNDERGSDACCRNWTQRRAESIKNFIMKNEIEPSRLIAKGYGETKPIYKNAKTEEEHHKNRRVEFKIVNSRYSGFDEVLFLKDSMYNSYDILFHFNKGHIPEESIKYLNEIVDFMSANDSIKIEIRVHSDERVNPYRSEVLSQRRAQAILDYFIKQGIESQRILSRGFEANKPIIKNAKTADEHAVNRRVEFRILP